MARANFNFALHLTEVSRQNLQADLDNVTNRTMFGPPNVQLGNATFGAVNNPARRLLFAAAGLTTNEFTCKGYCLSAPCVLGVACTVGALIDPAKEKV